MVFSITAGDAPAIPRAPPQELVVSEMSYHSDTLRPVLVGPAAQAGVLTPDELLRLNSVQGTCEFQLSRGLALKAAGLGLSSLDGFEGLDVRLASLDVSGNALFLDSFLDFRTRVLDLSSNGVDDEALGRFLEVLAGERTSGAGVEEENI